MKNRRKRRLMLLAFLTFAGALAYVAWPRQPQLLAKATRLFAAREFTDRSSERIEPIADYLWISDHQAVAYEFGHDSGLTRAFLLDTRTRRKTDVPALIAAINKQPMEIAFTWQLSPDRKWLLWWTEYAHIPNHVVAMTVDGAHTRLWSYESDYTDGSVWLPDRRSFVVFYSDSPERIRGAEVFRLDRHEPIRRISLDALHLDGLILGALPDGRILVAEGFRDTIPFAAFSLSAPSSAFRYSVSLPQGGEVEDLSLAPNGRLLAWVIQTKPKPPRFALLRRFYALLHLKPSVMDSLCVSLPDGSDMREIGAVKPEGGSVDIRLKGWLPDGRGLSFECHGWLWTVPLE